MGDLKFHIAGQETVAPNHGPSSFSTGKFKVCFDIVKVTFDLHSSNLCLVKVKTGFCLVACISTLLLVVSGINNLLSVAPLLA
jgi:hypothetical protein